MSTHLKIYLLIILTLLVCNKLNAQESDADKISFNVTNFTQQGNSLLIDIDFDLSALKLSSREQLTLTPIIRNGNTELALAPLIVNGKIRHKVYMRQQKFGTLEDNNPNAIEVVKAGKQEVQIISYSTVVGFEDWMIESSLYLNENYCSACGKAAIGYEQLLTESPTLEVVEIIAPILPLLVPPSDTLKTVNNKQSSAYLDFKVGRWTIDVSFANNAEELNKINTILEQIVNNNSITIDSISISGFGSIEGPYALNKTISENRAKELQNYIQQRYHLPNDLFKVEGFGEDWDGLINLIENGNMSQKQEILIIIKNTDIFDGREKQLMLFNKGNPYRFMLKEYFPLLRKVRFTIKYTIFER